MELLSSFIHLFHKPLYRFLVPFRLSLSQITRTLAIPSLPPTLVVGIFIWLRFADSVRHSLRLLRKILHIFCECAGSHTLLGDRQARLSGGKHEYLRLRIPLSTQMPPIRVAFFCCVAERKRILSPSFCFAKIPCVYRTFLAYTCLPIRLLPPVLRL